MRYQEFNLTEDELFELNMSPGNLQKMAANIDARVGMEFELIVPGVESEEEEEYDPEPDYEVDESFPTGRGWERDIISFFRGGDMGNSTSYIQRAIDSLNEDFWSWMDEAEQDFIASPAGQERIREIAIDNVDPSDYDEDSERELQQAIQDYIDQNEDYIRDEIGQEFRDDADTLFERWLDEQDITSMSEFASQYNLDWPYWTQPEYYGGGGGLVSIDAVADEFSDAIGRPVNASTSYHGGRREAGHYVVEPDGSLQGDQGETGLEFVSPVLTVPEMLADIDKVAKWASQSGAYTNSSTGLHMNVSVPDQQSLDYVKLAMFLGDEYILKQFGREGNSYCKSALKKIKYNAKTDPSRVEEMMRQFQGGLNQLASKLIHTGSTEKFVSINNRGDWIEFRSPGGDWLGDDLGLVKNTLLRAVVALDVATKPQEFKQEYYKKLYKTLSQGSSDDSIQYFARYAAGELPASALKSFVRQIQQKRAAGKKGPVEEFDVPFVWKVVGSPDSPYQSQGTEVVATSERRALEAAVKKWNLNIYPRSVEEFTQRWRATPMRPASDADLGSGQASSRDQEFSGVWEVVSRATDDVVYRFNAQEAGMSDPRSVAQAEDIADRWRQGAAFTGAVYVRPQMRPIQARSGEPVPAGAVSGSTQDLQRQRLAAQMPALNTADGNWEIYSIASNNTVYRFTANTEEQAVQAFRIWQDAVREPSLPRATFNLRTTPGASPQVQQQQTADRPAADTRPPYSQRWRILDRDNQEIYSFMNTNAQSDANAAAMRWLTTMATPETRERGPFEVVHTITTR
jgi:hypothetical protein